MNNLLGIFSSFYDNMFKIAIFIGIIALMIACLKYKNGRIIILTLIIGAISIGFIAIVVYCGVQINTYYKASGGIYGQIVDWYKPNEVVISDEVTYSFKNLALTKDGDLYSAKITSDEVLDLKLDENATYGVYVNDMPCNYVEITENYVIAKYRYAFYDINFNAICEDTLTLRFVFDTNQTRLSISTEGGVEAVKYWNNYFNRNIFDVTIDNQGYTYSKDITFGNGDVSDYSVVSYYLDDTLFVKQVYKNGATINLPNTEKYVWLFEDNSNVTTDYVIEQNISLYTYPYTLTFNTNGGNCETQSKKLYYADAYGELPIATKEGAKFNGWFTSAVGGDEVTSATLMANEDTTLYAQWSNATYTIRFDGNGATSGSMADMTFTYGVERALKTNAFSNGDAHFAGWSTSPDGEVEFYNGATIYNLTSNDSEIITLYAIWTTNYYTARIYTMGTGGSYPTGYTINYINSLSGEIDVTIDAEANLDIVENGLVFDYATDLDGNIITTTNVAEDNSTIVCFYYKRIQHTLNIDANGGTFLYLSGWQFNEDYTTANASRYYQQNYGTLPTATRYGYDLIGWFTSATNGTQVSLNTSMDLEDVTLYAQWEKIANFDETTINPAIYNIDLEKLSNYTSDYLATNANIPNISIQRVISAKYYNDRLQLFSIAKINDNTSYIINTMSYENKSQSITEIIDAQQDFKCQAKTYLDVELDVIYELFPESEFAYITLDGRENLEDGYNYSFVITTYNDKYAYTPNTCFDVKISFYSSTILSKTKMEERLTELFEIGIRDNEELEYSIINEKPFIKVNNTYIFEFDENLEEQQVYTITFSYVSGSVTETEEWTIENQIATKSVIAGQEIGDLPQYTPATLSYIDYWYYLDSNGNQVIITETSIMPEQNIQIFVVTKSMEVDDNISST